MDKQLLETQTRKEIAQQQKAQYEQEAAAQEQRIAVEEKKSRADQQGSVITAKLSIDIENDKAEALRRQAQGVRDSTKTRADGTAYEAERIGQGQAAAYKAQTDILGQDNVTALKLFQEVAEGKIVITPQIMVTGGGSDTSSNMWNAYLSTLLKKWYAADEEKPKTS